MKRLLFVFMALCTLFAFAGSAMAGIDVVVLSSDDAGQMASVKAALEFSYVIDTVDEINIQGSTPALADIQSYDVVVYHANDTPFGAVALGDVLADYVDLGGKGLVLFVAGFTTLYGPSGRLVSGNYLPMTQGGNVIAIFNLENLADHPINTNITSLTQSVMAVTSIAVGATTLGDYDDAGDTPIGAIKGNVIGLNIFPKEIALHGDDELIFTVNAVHWLAGLLRIPDGLADPLEYRRYPALVSDGQYIYMTGGWDSLGDPQDTHYRYDPETDSWSTLAALPVSTGEISGVFYDGKIYVFGGLDVAYESLSSTYVYDIATDIWSSGADLPLSLSGSGVALIGDEVLVAGGYNSDAGDNQVKAYLYDIAGDSWTAMPDSNFKHWWPAIGQLGRKIFVGLGNASVGVNSAACETFDVDTHAWSDGGCADSPSANSRTGSFAADGLLYADLGTLGQNTWVYDPVQDEWSEAPVVSNMFANGGAAVTLNGKAYITGTFAPGPYLESFDVCHEVETIACGDTVSGDTTDNGDYYNYYSCDNTRDEDGEEAKYQFTLAAAQAVRFEADDAGASVYILSDCSPSNCVAVGDGMVEAVLEAGDYWVVIDSASKGTFDLTATCCDGCLVDDTCVADGDANGGNTCETCDMDAEPFAWTVLADGDSCDDGEFCTGDDTCQAGVCDDHAGDPCDPDTEVCNETTDSCDDLADDDDDDDDTTDDDDDDTPGGIPEDDDDIPAGTSSGDDSDGGGGCCG